MMDLSTATEKLQKFFGLSDSDDGDTSYAVQGNTAPKVNQSQDKQSRPFQPSRQEERQTTYVKSNPPKSRVKETPATDMSSSFMNNKVVQMNRSSHSSRSEQTKTTSQKISLVEPRTYMEAKEIAKGIFRSEIVIVNFRLVEEAQARRIVDFLTGAVYALDGDIQRIGDEMFICTPPNAEIDSKVAENLMQSQFTEF